MAEHIFKKEDLVYILENAVNKTLGEVDTKNVFERTKKHPKITGIAGDVIEQSVLGYPADTKQEPDLIVDGIEIELKTTGIKISKSDGHEFEAKEPMSITAVSPEKITKETFLQSNFWHKLERMLLIYYHYDSKVPVKASEYANFFIKGYHFHEFSDREKEILKNDWTIVKEFIQIIQKEFNKPETQYPRISNELRPKLMMIDTAPKWPNRPRFRLKRSSVSSIVQQYFGEKLIELEEDFSSYSEIDQRLHKLTMKYKGNTFQELVNILQIDVKKLKDEEDDYSKSIGEQIVTGMFGSKVKKMASIKLFNEIGLTVKTITQTTEGFKTEDTKLIGVDFSEWLNDEISFEDSSLYSYFSNPFLFIIFEEPKTATRLADNIFKGFKRITFNDEFIYNNVKKLWDDVRALIKENRLVDEICYRKDGTTIINKTGIIKSAPNFPKSQHNDVFIRGTSGNSTKKPLEINGVRMYKQNVWIKGNVINEMLNNNKYI